MGRDRIRWNVNGNAMGMDTEPGHHGDSLPDRKSDGHLSMPGDVDQVDRRTPVNDSGRRPGRLMDTCQ